MTTALVVPTIEYFRNRILCTDALTLLNSLPSGSVHCIVTSPPYFGLRDYGVDGQIGLEDTPEVFISRLVTIFREARRVLRDDGTLWINIGDSYSKTTTGRKDTRDGGRINGKLISSKVVPRTRHREYSGLPSGSMMLFPQRLIIALQNDGWVVRSDIIWHKTSVLPESMKDRPSKTHEYVFLLSKSARKLFWIHRDGSVTRNKPAPDYIWRDKLTNAECQQEPPGFDVETLPNGKKRWSRINLWEGRRYFYDQDAIREPLAESTMPRMNRAVSDDNKAVDGAPGQSPHTINQPRGSGAGGQQVNPLGANKKSVWRVFPDKYPGSHFATFPPDLIEPMIKAGCPSLVCEICGAPHVRTTEKVFIPQQDVSPARVAHRGKMADENHWKGFPRGTNQISTTGFEPSCECGAGTKAGIVLDPFMGSGTTAVVARRRRRDYVGCDLNPEYVEMAQKRIDQEDPTKPKIHANGDKQLSLFAEATL